MIEITNKHGWTLRGEAPTVEPFDPFDPFAYGRDVKANPHNYVKLTDCIDAAIALGNIRRAKTMDALKKAFTVSAKAAKAAKDTDLINMLTKAKDQRKTELQAA